MKSQSVDGISVLLPVGTRYLTQQLNNNNKWGGWQYAVLEGRVCFPANHIP